MSLWKNLTARRRLRAERRVEDAEFETPAERRFAAGGVDAVAADEVVQEQLGGVNPSELIDDEFESQ